jgi:probable HAF family extracellular repeat protein
MFKFAVVRVVCLAAALCGGAGAQATVSYRITDLGDLVGGSNYSHAYGINDLGQVVGVSSTATGERAFLWSASGGIQDLGDLTGGNDYSVALGINNKGQVVGTSATATGNHAFLWSIDGGMQDLGYLAGGSDTSSAYSINNHGQIVGASTGSGAFLWSVSSGMQKIGDGIAYGINDNGLVVGGNGYGAFLWSANGGIQNVDLPGGSDTGVAYGTSDNGQVVGMGSTATGDRAFLRDTSGGMQDLGDLAGGRDFSVANDINNRGEAVGTSGINGGPALVGRYGAFLWSASDGMQSLNDLIAIDDPLKASFRLVEARGINDAGQIVGFGSINGVEHAFLLTAVPEPNALLLVLAGLLGLQPKRLNRTCRGAAKTTASPLKMRTLVSAVCATLIAGCGGGGSGSGSSNSPIAADTPASNTETGNTATQVQPSSVQVAPGHGYTLVLMADGSVVVLGSGMKGGGALTPKSGTTGSVINGLNNPSAVYANARMSGSSNNSFAIDRAGAVWGWGTDDSNAISGVWSSSVQTVQTPVTMPLLGAARALALCNADTMVFALHADGSVSYLPSVSGPQGIQANKVSDLTGVTAIYSDIAGDASCKPYALRSDGALWQIQITTTKSGSTTTNSASTAQVVGLPAIQQLSCGFDHCLALANDGTVWSWGGNGSGQLGDGSQTSRTTPVQVSGLPVTKKLLAGLDVSYALTAGGGLLGWGGLGTKTWTGGGANWSATPLLMYRDTAGIVDLSVYEENASIALENGSLWGWGNNTRGELGDGTTTLATSDNAVQALGVTLK